MADPKEGGNPVARLVRYSLAAVGPIGSAGAQFLLSLVLLRTLDPQAFGSFSFLLIASQLSWGLWSALFCAPLPILLHQGDETARAQLLRCLFSTNLVGAAVAAVLFWAIAAALGVPPLARILFAVYGALALLRWFGRAHAYATGTPLRSTASDLVYSGTLLLGVALAILDHAGSLQLAYGALLVSAFLGLIPFGRTYLRAQFGRFSLFAIRGYGAIWRMHSGWSLLGVLTTEATGNAHVYIVTLFFGPAAFAPIAASALMIRPIGVAINALTEFERAQMARQIVERRLAAVNASVRMFRTVLVGAWIVTASVAAVILAYAPHIMFPSHYPLHFLVTGAALWMLVAGMRLVRTPESALLQAAGAFRQLAFASVVSSGVSIVLVLLLLWTAGPLWSILGIVLGEAVFAGWTWMQAHRWRDEQKGLVMAQAAPEIRVEA
ncbi:MAG: hypothetical protein DI547_13770 [Sphingobium sp.]|nr:MAG: hypothetical protein DI547_13770 [Sphingobium sp.]